MATKVLVPLLGEGVEEVTVIKWLKKEGDSLNELEPLLEVNTDKVDTEIPSPATGILLEIEISEGTTVEAGTLLAVIADSTDKAVQTAGMGSAIPVKTPVEIKPVPAVTSFPSAAPVKRESSFISPW